MAQYYFITTDGNLITGDEEFQRGKKDLSETCAKKGREICHAFELYDNNCRLPYTTSSNLSYLRIVFQHSDIIKQIMDELKSRGITKLDCQYIGREIPDIILFFGLGLDDNNFNTFKKYIEKSKYILDWGRNLTKQKFDYRNKLAYYEYLNPEPLPPKPSSRFIPPYHSINNLDDLMKKVEFDKNYLLKDISGSGGGGIYPIIKIKEQGIDKIQIMDQTNQFINMERVTDDYFLQEFKIPFTVSGKDIITHLLKLEEFDNPQFRIDILPIFNKFKVDNDNENCNTFSELFTLLNNITHKTLHSILYAFYFCIRILQNKKHGNPIDTIHTEPIIYTNVMTTLNNKLKFIDLVKSTCNNINPDVFNLLDSHLKYYIFFNNQNLYMLKFRRPYLHFNKNNTSIILPAERFDIDMIFDFNIDLSLKQKGLTLFNQFISNNTAGNSINLDFHIKTIHNENRGVYELFNKVFTVDEQRRILESEKVIYNDLKDSIEINTNYEKDLSDKICFKYYAIDYIIDKEKQINILEVNDSAIIQKDMKHFVSKMIDLIVTDNTNTELDRIITEQREIEKRQRRENIRKAKDNRNLDDLLIKFEKLKIEGGNIYDKTPEKYKQKYLKYKQKYLQLKLQLKL